MGLLRRKFLLGVMLLGLPVLVASRFDGLGEKSLWEDEMATLSDIRAGFPEFMTNSVNWDHPPGYFLVAYWTSLLFGFEPWSIRLPSAFAGIVSVVFASLIACQIRSKWCGLLVFVLMTIDPYQVYYSQEARVHQLAVAAVLANVYFLGVWMTKERNWLNWLGYVFSAAVGLYTFYVAAIPMVAAGVIGLVWSLFGDRTRFLPLIGAAMVIFLLFCPWLPIAFEYFQAQSGSSGRTLQFDISLLTRSLLLFGRLDQTLLWSALLMGLLSYRNLCHFSFVLALIIPLLSILILSTVDPHRTIYHRHLMTYQSFIWVLVGVGFSTTFELTHRLASRLSCIRLWPANFALLAIPFCVLAYPRVERDLWHYQTDKASSKQLVSYLLGKYESGDLIYAAEYGTWAYLKGDMARSRTFPRLPDMWSLPEYKDRRLWYLLSAEGHAKKRRPAIYGYVLENCSMQAKFFAQTKSGHGTVYLCPPYASPNIKGRLVSVDFSRDWQVKHSPQPY